MNEVRREFLKNIQNDLDTACRKLDAIATDEAVAGENVTKIDSAAILVERAVLALDEAIEDDAEN